MCITYLVTSQGGCVLGIFFWEIMIFRKSGLNKWIFVQMNLNFPGVRKLVKYSDTEEYGMT